jgi:branched-chain amino acid transport system permease protein
MGKSMRAVSHSMTNASLLGINVNRVVVFTFVLGSSLAGIGSVLVGLKYPKIEPLMGVMIGLKGFVAAVLGGIGNMSGAVLGALIMGLSEEFVVAYLSSTLRDALAFGLLIGILIWKPSGLMGKNSSIASRRYIVSSSSLELEGRSMWKWLGRWRWGALVIQNP